MNRDQTPENPGPEDLAALELFQQLAALSPAEDATAVRLTIRLPNGRYVGDVLLSAKAEEALTDATISLNSYLADGGEAPVLEPSAPLPEVDPGDVAEMISALQDLADGEL